MQSLIAKAKRAHASAPRAVFPSIPILYFGDCDAFRRSKTRIVTVGLNPSKKEFPSDPFQRFPAFKSSYQVAWNKYFQNSPYDWFSTFSHLLEGFDASFYGDRQHTALHTDLFSPVATDPTWSKLSQSDRESLGTIGIPLWHDLIRYLKPHILLISIADRHKKEIEFSLVQNWKQVFRATKKKDGTPRREPYDVMHSVVRISDNFNADILFGQAAQKPFATLSNCDKAQIGKRLRNRLTNW
jgi:hypothetical protein